MVREVLTNPEVSGLPTAMAHIKALVASNSFHGKSMTKKISLFPLLTLMFLVAFSSCTPPPSNVREQTIHRGSPLVIQPARMDMGEVVEGKEAKATFFLRNTGSLPVHVSRVESSCGCTAATPETRELAPGAFTPLHVRVDTTAKRGMVKKSITVFDSQGGTAQAWLTLAVKPNPHTGAMQAKSIFDGKCAACHAEPAKGKVRGFAIYRAVCAMCHGEKAEGVYAPGLRGRDAAFLSSTLVNGLGRKMPSFSRKKSGPLTKVQIANVSKWLSELDEQVP